jgi:DNA-binding HxlR family transcriptional regulator
MPESSPTFAPISNCINVSKAGADEVPLPIGQHCKFSLVLPRQFFTLTEGFYVHPWRLSPINLTLEQLGDSWSLIVIRDLMFGNKCSYGELLAQSEEGIASNILADRLKRLAAAGLLTRRADPEHKQKGIYSLTEPAIQLVAVPRKARRHRRRRAWPKKVAKGAARAPAKTAVKRKSLKYLQFLLCLRRLHYLRM